MRTSDGKRLQNEPVLPRSEGPSLEVVIGLGLGPVPGLEVDWEDGTTDPGDDPTPEGDENDGEEREPIVGGEEMLEGVPVFDKGGVPTGDEEGV